ncbi:hypothetical protein DEJ36_04940 [Curtobacterium sp. MCPF17_052]|nr:hypothetical protein [Curtobacterium sp. MCPF17_052]WIB13222.1 hypothetical protein DEJ36_04940 [Curtobacterium sp. MCPF17_052]
MAEVEQVLQRQGRTGRLVDGDRGDRRPAAPGHDQIGRQGVPLHRVRDDDGHRDRQCQRREGVEHPVVGGDEDHGGDVLRQQRGQRLGQVEGLRVVRQRREQHVVPRGPGSTLETDRGARRSVERIARADQAEGAAPSAGECPRSSPGSVPEGGDGVGDLRPELLPDSGVPVDHTGDGLVGDARTLGDVEDRRGLASPAVRRRGRRHPVTVPRHQFGDATSRSGLDELTRPHGDHMM